MTTRRPNPAGLATALVLAVLGLTTLACGGKDGAPYRVRRLAAAVQAGIPAVSPPLVTNDEWSERGPGEGIKTDESGRADLEVAGCSGSVRILPETSLRLGACRGTEGQDDMATCTFGGTSYIHLTCTEPYLADTYGGRVTVSDAVLSLTYVAERRVTLAVVLAGNATVQPVLDFRSGELGPAVQLGAGQFLYTVPGIESLVLAGVPARQPLSLDRLARVVVELGIRGSMASVGTRASNDGLLPATWPEFPTPEPGGRVTFLLYTAGGPLEDPAVQYALLQAIKKSPITEQMFGRAKVSFLSEVAGATVDVGAIAHNPAAARDAIAAAGYPDGFGMSMIYPASDRNSYWQIGEAIMSDLQNVGLDVALDPFGYADMYGLIQQLIDEDKAVLWLERY